MTTMKRTIAALLLALPALAFAHAGPEADHGLLAGLAHPFTGLDHLAAMLAVGFWTALIARRGRLDLVLVPLAFVALLATGAVFTAVGVAVPAVEPLIAASLLCLGLLVGLQVRLPLPAAMALIAAFAFFHGAAHGQELAGGAALVGLALGTGALHLLGMAAALAVRHRGRAWPRAAGAALGLMGATLLLGTIT
jgi:urease accessory protein